MTHRPPKPKPRQLLPAGFALVITISILVLLILVAIGLLTLSTVTLRSTNQGSAHAEARANARLALILALGDLQKQLGPDQRITARADILDKNAVHPHWTGVWESWKAGRTKSGGDAVSDHATIPGTLNEGMSPSYTPGREDHFRAWLVSLTREQQKSLDSAKSLALDGGLTPGKDADSVKLLGKGSLGTAPGNSHVRAGLTRVSATPAKPGRFGWWIADESTKAGLAGDSRRTTWNRSIADRIFQHQAPGNTGFRSLAPFVDLADPAEFERTFSRASLALLKGVDRGTLAGQFHHTTPYSYGLACDVREGGLQRDLSGLLERPINTSETGDGFMLYRFGRSTDRVPIQDLSAYYQLYRSQITFRSPELSGGIHIKNPDFKRGGQDFTREYTNLYRLPVPIKVQFLLSLSAEERTATEKQNNPRNTDTHKLNVGITPAITYWNPYSVPLAMNLGADYATQFRFFNLPLAIKWTKEGRGYTSTTPTSLAWISNGAGSGDRDTGFTAFFSGTRPIVFEPGQVRVFSLANTQLRQLVNSDTFKEDREVVAGWNPDLYIRLRRSDRSDNAQHIEPPAAGDREGSLTFSISDRISFTIEPTEVEDLANGSALQFFNRQSSVGGAAQWMGRQYQLVSRLKGSNSDFNKRLMEASFPQGITTFRFEAKTGSDIIRGPVPFLVVNLMAGCETHESASLGPYGGRHFPSRPFLHSSPVVGTVFIDDETSKGAYQHGWNWWVEEINSPFDANISIDRSNNGYYGGGYTVENGSTHVVQQEVPVVPPISIAALSHAQLGGYSLADAYLGPGASETTVNFQDTTASGQGGLFPHTVQAIGNSYAHPQLAADQASGLWSRKFTELAAAKQVPFVDHSYLANKALWDEYFFSSIAPSTTTAFAGGDGGDARKAAERFFLAGGRLPNERFVPYLDHLDEAAVGKLFDRTVISLAGADRIASHMMMKGPFNINSTSVDAWRALFSSLKGRNVSFLGIASSLNGRTSLDSQTVTGTPVSSFSLPNGKPYTGSPSRPSDPAQWSAWRELSDDEIDELAEAMVEQVRLRGPFLSLSEFVNRRLDGSRKALAVKGALQAALDDPKVSINSGFRGANRLLDASQTGRMGAAFPEALEGPAAYGSAAYIDQADVLRNFAGQLTPRGDTFLIRTYGDSLDTNGTVQARAWCEAVVQRIPDYLDPKDLPHLKFDDLSSALNKSFGRRFRVLSFRYLSASEV
jgi:hypothetical protein